MKYVTVIIEAISKLLVPLMAYLKGRTDIENKQLNKSLENIHKAHDARSEPIDDDSLQFDKANRDRH